MLYSIDAVIHGFLSLFFYMISFKKKDYDLPRMNEGTC